MLETRFLPSTLSKIILSLGFLSFFGPRAVPLLFLWRVDHKKVDLTADFHWAGDLNEIVAPGANFPCSTPFIREGFKAFWVIREWF